MGRFECKKDLKKKEVILYRMVVLVGKTKMMTFEFKMYKSMLVSQLFSVIPPPTHRGKTPPHGISSDWRLVYPLSLK